MAGKHSFVKNYSKLTLHTMGKSMAQRSPYILYIRTRYKYIESRTHRVEDIEELSRRVIPIQGSPFPPVLTTVLAFFVCNLLDYIRAKLFFE